MDAGIKCINDECDGTMVPFYVREYSGFGSTHWVCLKCGTKVALSPMSYGASHSPDKGWLLEIDKVEVLDGRKKTEEVRGD